MSRLYDILNDMVTKLNALLGRPYIVEEGWASSWRYRKWNNGFIEAWRQGVNYGTVGSSAWVSPVRFYDITYAIPSEIGFTNAPAVIATGRTKQWWVVGMEATSSTSITGRVSTMSSTAQPLIIGFYVFGT